MTQVRRRAKLPSTALILVVGLVAVMVGFIVGVSPGYLVYVLAVAPIVVALAVRAHFEKGTGRNLSRWKERWVPWYIIGSCAITVLLNGFAPGHPSGSERLLAAAMVVAAGVETELWARDPERRFPLAPFYSWLHVMYYAIPVFVRSQFTRAWYITDVSSGHARHTALVLATCGLVTLLLAYHVVARILPQPTRAVSNHILVGSDRTWLVAAAVSVVVYLASLAYHVPAFLEQPVLIMGELSTLGVMNVLVAARTRGISRVTAIIAFGILLPLRVLAGLSTGFLHLGLAPAFALLFGAAVLARRFPWRLGMLIVGAFLVLWPAKLQFGYHGGNSLRNSSGFLSATSQTVRGGVTLHDAVQESAGRVSSIFEFADIIDRTPRVVPYWHGGSYSSIMSQFVPRVLLPTKAQNRLGNTFGQRYGLLAAGDQQTNLGVPHLIEFYINFGPGGVIVGMGLIGVVFGLLVYWAGTVPRVLLSTGGVLFFLSTLLIVEVPLSTIVAGGGYSFVLLLAARMIVRGWNRDGVERGI